MRSSPICHKKLSTCFWIVIQCKFWCTQNKSNDDYTYFIYFFFTKEVINILRVSLQNCTTLCLCFYYFIFFDDWWLFHFLFAHILRFKYLLNNAHTFMNHRRHRVKTNRDNRSCYAGSLFARAHDAYTFISVTKHWSVCSFYSRYSVNLIKLGNNAFQMDCWTLEKRKEEGAITDQITSLMQFLSWSSFLYDFLFFSCFLTRCWWFYCLWVYKS